MRGIKYMGLIWILLLCGMQTAFAQTQNGLMITNDRLVLVIDLKSTPAELDSLFNIAGISGIKPAAIKRGDFAAINNDGWQLAFRQNDVVQFERLLTAMDYNPQSRPFKISTFIPSLNGKP